MSEPTVIDAEHIEREHTIEERVQEVEQLVRVLFEQHKNMLENFRELIEIVTEYEEE